MHHCKYKSYTYIHKPWEYSLLGVYNGIVCIVYCVQLSIVYCILCKCEYCVKCVYCCLYIAHFSYLAACTAIVLYLRISPSVHLRTWCVTIKRFDLIWLSLVISWTRCEFSGHLLSYNNHKSSTESCCCVLHSPSSLA